MDYDELREYLKTNVLSEYGVLKLRKVPDYIKKEIIRHTLFYEYYGNTHMSIRCYFILEGMKGLPICDHCGKPYSIKTKNQFYTQKFCNRKCGNDSEKTKQKSKNTNLKRYGVEYPTQIEETIKKQRKTNLQKYGVEHVLQKKEFSEKRKKTTLERHGVVTCFENPEIQEKIKQLNVKKYGVEYPLFSEEILEKIKQTNIEKYGNEYAIGAETVRNKIKQTNIERYGSPYPAQKHLSPEAIGILNDKDKFADFIVDKSAYEIAKELGILVNSVFLKTRKYDVSDLYKRSSRSYLEVEMEEFLNELNINYEANNRTILNGKELDFYIPDYNIAIEMNGIYWHSDKFIDKNYHYAKWKMCYDSGIHLISIFEDDWINQKEKIKNIIKNHLGFRKKSVDNSYIKKIDNSLANQFVKKYNIQEFTDGYHYSAFGEDDNLLDIITINNINDNVHKITNYECNHPGLFSKLFNYAQNDLNFKEVVVFVDNSYFSGNIYKENGFEFNKIIGPDYHYYFNNKRTDKINFSKDNIKKKFPEFSELIDSGMSEFQITNILDIPRIYDCGQCEWRCKSSS